MAESRGILGDLFGKKDDDKKDDKEAAAKPTAAELAKEKQKAEAEERAEKAKKAQQSAVIQDVKDAAAKKAALPHLAVDGAWGAATTKAVQAAIGTPQTGEAWINNADAKVLQQKLGVTADGLFGKGSNTALQKYLGVAADGVFGPNSVKALQTRLNAGTFFA